MWVGEEYGLWSVNSEIYSRQINNTAMLMDQFKSVQTDLKSSFCSTSEIQTRFNFELRDIFLTALYKIF